MRPCAAHNTPNAAWNDCLPAGRCHSRASLTKVFTKLQLRKLVSCEERIQREGAGHDPEGQTLLTADSPPNTAITRFMECNPHALKQLRFKKPHTSNVSEEY